MANQPHLQINEEKIQKHVAGLYQNLVTTQSMYFEGVLDEEFSEQEKAIILLQTAANFFRVTVVTKIDEDKRINAINHMHKTLLSSLNHEDMELLKEPPKKQEYQHPVSDAQPIPELNMLGKSNPLKDLN